MKVQGIRKGPNTYEVTVDAKWRWLRKLLLWFFALGHEHEIMIRDDRRIVFNR
jgi:hypothetical protein